MSQQRKTALALGLLGALLASGAAVVALRPDVVDDFVTAEKGPLHVDESTLEVPELADAAVMKAAMGLARATLEGQAADPAALGTHTGRRVFTCAYGVQPQAVCGMGVARDLAASVQASARDLARHDLEWERATLKLDFVVSEARTRWTPTRRAPGFNHGIGMHGVLVEHGGASAWLTPSQIIETGVWEVDKEGRGELIPKKLTAALQQRAPDLGELPADFAFTRFRTTSWVESPAGIVRTYRLHTYEMPDPTPDLLLQRSVWAADYLASSIEANGRIRYLFDPVEDQERKGYNLLRHAGTTWSLIQAWERVGYDPWLDAARGAIDYLLTHSRVQERHGPYGGGETRWVKETSRIKLGGAGLAVLALAEYTAATGDDRYMEELRQFARFLVSAQKESGEFVYFSPIDPEDPPHDRTSAYYPGEAIVGLMRLYAIDPDPLWLETAERGAAWLIRVRDSGVTPARLANDHWLMIGLSRLYAETKDPMYLEHSLKLAKAVEIQQARHRDHVKYHRDYQGGYYQPPRSTPAATRGEGLVAVLDTCREAEMPCEDVRRILVETVRHELLSQYTPETVWWVPTVGNVFGAFSGGIVDPTVRNDYVQHNLSSILGLERHMRAQQGVRLPGDPRWTPEDQRAFSGPSADQLAVLRAASVEARGPTRWDPEPGQPQDGDVDALGAVREPSGDRVSPPSTNRHN